MTRACGGAWDLLFSWNCTGRAAFLPTQQILPVNVFRPLQISFSESEVASVEQVSLLSRQRLVEVFVNSCGSKLHILVSTLDTPACPLSRGLLTLVWYPKGPLETGSHWIKLPQAASTWRGRENCVLLRVTSAAVRRPLQGGLK